MRKIILVVLILISLQGVTQEVKINNFVNNPLASQINQKSPKKGDPQKYFNVEFDWMLETKTELINGIWYSPIIEFSLKTQRGFNFQIQTGALPMLDGYQLYKANPTAGVSLGYSF